MKVKIDKIGSHGFPLSDYQIDIIDFIANEPESGSRNLLVQAFAGCSKTTTIMEALNYIPKSKSVLLTCFNKRIANELQELAPKHVVACTMNSLGYKMLRDYVQSEGDENGGRYINMNGGKIVQIVKQMIATGDEEFKGYEWMISKLCESAKNHGLIPKDSKFGHKTVMADTQEEWFELMDRFGVATKIQAKVTGIITRSYAGLSAKEKANKTEELLRQTKNMVVRGSREALCKNIEILSTVDFTDQLYLPFVYGIQYGEVDYIFVDEAQDLNPIQHEMLTLCIGPESRMIGVGDRKQAIYQFRGSMSDSMDKLLERFNCIEKTLPLSYRCPKEVIKEAQVFVPEIQNALNHEGNVEDKGMYDMADFNAGDMVLCRFNAPLMTIAYDLLSAHIPFEIRGKDFIGDLISMVMGFEVKTIEELYTNLEAWKFAQVDKKLKEDPDANVSSVEDKYEALMEFLRRGNFKYVGSAVKKLKELQEKCRGNNDGVGGGVILSTVHQSKGLEAETVYFVNVGQLPCKYAKTDEEMEAEMNIAYVGVTRSKKNLFYIATAVEALLNKIDAEIEEHGECTLKENDELLQQVLNDKRKYGLGFALQDFLLEGAQASGYQKKSDPFGGPIDPMGKTDDEGKQELIDKTIAMTERNGMPEHEVDGHWRKIPSTATGKDAKGNRNQKGRTWVNEHSRGEDLPEPKDFINIKRAESDLPYKEATVRTVSSGVIHRGNVDEVVAKITEGIAEKHGIEPDPFYDGDYDDEGYGNGEQ